MPVQNLNKVIDSSCFGDLVHVDWLGASEARAFPLNTPYINVIGHLARANLKFGFRTLLIDQTGIGELVLEELREQSAQNVDGVTFRLSRRRRF